MTEYRDLKKDNMILTLVLWCIIGSISMAVMLMTASSKVIVIADAGQEQTATVADNTQERLPGGALLLERDSKALRQLTIPLEVGIKAENVVMENRYVERELWIYIKQAQYSFYEENAIVGDIAWVQGARYEAQEDGVILKLIMSDVMEYHSTLENGSLKLALSYPWELYEYIVVIDPVGDEITGQVAKLLQKEISSPKIKAYYTRTEDVKISADKRLKLIEAVGADLYLQLGLSENPEDSSVYGIQTFYNDEYFIPGFGNIQWADLITRKVTIAASNLAIGLQPAEGVGLLSLLKISGAQVNLGFVTNSQEAALLQQESYQQKLAQGIAEAILEAYTTNNKENQQVEKVDE